MPTSSIQSLIEVAGTDGQGSGQDQHHDRETNENMAPSPSSSTGCSGPSRPASAATTAHLPPFRELMDSLQTLAEGDRNQISASPRVNFQRCSLSAVNPDTAVASRSRRCSTEADLDTSSFYERPPCLLLCRPHTCGQATYSPTPSPNPSRRDAACSETSRTRGGSEPDLNSVDWSFESAVNEVRFIYSGLF